MKEHDVKLDDLGTFRTRVMAYGAAAATLGGFLAALAFKLIDWLGK